MRRTGAALILAGLAVGAGHAIAEPQGDEVLRRLGALEARVAKMEAQSQSQGLLSLLNEIEQLKAEVARLRGVQEEQAHRLAMAEKRQKDLYADLDTRIKDVASRPMAAQNGTAAQAAQADPAEAETKAYQTAFEQIKLGNYKAAITAFQGFLKGYPAGALASNAQYWVGFAYFSLGEFKEAAAAHQKLLQLYPTSPKVPDAMLGLARAQLQSGEVVAGKATLEQIVAKHPTTKAAENAGKLLATLK